MICNEEAVVCQALHPGWLNSSAGASVKSAMSLWYIQQHSLLLSVHTDSNKLCCHQCTLLRDMYCRLEDEEGLVLTPFEKNLEVWRQLWRVLERSDIVVQASQACISHKTSPASL